MRRNPTRSAPKHGSAPKVDLRAARASFSGHGTSLDQVRYVPKRLVLPPDLPGAHIDALPERGEVFYRRHDGGRPGPTLLLLHGWTASADLQWFTAYPTLAERYSFLAIDHRGHGRGLRSDEPFTLEAAADDAAALVRQLGVGPVVTVGYSMGGPISLLMAHRHPDVVQGLVLEATSQEWHATLTDRLTWRFLVVMEIVLRSRWARVLGRRAVRRLAENNPAIEPYIGWLQAEGRRGDPSDIIEAGRALSNFDARPFAAAIGKPAAVVLTTGDRGVRPAKQQALAAAVGARIFELPGDHFSFWANTKEFADVTRQAVDDVVSRLPVASA
jgi:pimeloyl-ACP methyl ester carboxylesterase